MKAEDTASILIRDTGVTITQVLRMISEGFSYDQILRRHPKLMMGDILLAARFAVEFIEKFVTAEGDIQVDKNIELTAHDGRLVNLTEARQAYSRAYRPWRRSEEEQLVKLYKHGAGVYEIARIHQRHPTAIRKRLHRLGLVLEEQ